MWQLVEKQNCSHINHFNSKVDSLARKITWVNVCIFQGGHARPWSHQLEQLPQSNSTHACIVHIFCYEVWVVWRSVFAYIGEAILSTFEMRWNPYLCVAPSEPTSFRQQWNTETWLSVTICNRREKHVKRYFMKLLQLYYDLSLQ